MSRLNSNRIYIMAAVGLTVFAVFSVCSFLYVKSQSDLTASNATVSNGTTVPVHSPALPPTTFVLTIKLTYADAQSGDLLPEAKSAIYVVAATSASPIDEALSESRAAIASKYTRGAETLARKKEVEKQLEDFEAKENADRARFPIVEDRDKANIQNGNATDDSVTLSSEILEFALVIKSLRQQNDQLALDLNRLSAEMSTIKDTQLAKLQDVFKDRSVDVGFADLSGIARFSNLPASDYVVYSLPFN